MALVALSAYFSATETAFTSLNRIRLKTRADDGDKRAARTLALAADFDRLLSTLLIGNNIVNNVATTIGAVLFIQLIGPGKGPTVSATVLTIVILVFGELTDEQLNAMSDEEYIQYEETWATGIHNACRVSVKDGPDTLDPVTIQMAVSKTDDGKWSIDDDSILRFNESLMFYPESFE